MSRFYTRAELISQRAQWKSEGKKVVFTNGCYDILHPGHVRLLERARSLGDVLILALNTDASVQRLKGPARPFFNEQIRVERALIGHTSLPERKKWKPPGDRYSHCPSSPVIRQPISPKKSWRASEPETAAQLRACATWLSSSDTSSDPRAISVRSQAARVSNIAAEANSRRTGAVYRLRPCHNG